MEKDMEDNVVESVDLVEDLEEEKDSATKEGLKRKRKDRAQAWQYFTNLKELSIDGKTQCTSSSNATNEYEKPGDGSTCANGVRAQHMDFDQFDCQDDSINKKSEMQLYLDEPRIDRKSELDVLDFWKGNEFRYPILARMARDFLTIPISTGASESTFSASGRILDQHRSSLSKDTFEALMCTKDWLFAKCCSDEVNLNELTEDIMRSLLI